MDREWQEVRGPDGRTFGERVAELREERGWNQGELAERVTGSNRPSTAGAWESGANPKAGTVVALARALDVDPGWLLTGEGPQQRREPSEAEDLLDRIESILLDRLVSRARNALPERPGDDEGPRGSGGG